MAYDAGLVARLDEIIADNPEFQKKKMFGGFAYQLNGNICFGVHKDYLIIRVGPNLAQGILQEPHTKPMDFTGKVMKGWVMVAPEAISEDENLQRFISSATSFTATLTPKT